MSFRIITANLITQTALHVGAGERSNVADDLLRRNAKGDIIIPGTSLAGAMRAIATRIAPRLGADVCIALKTDHQGGKCGCLVCKLFGEINPQEDEGGASRLIVYDAVLKEDVETVIRDGVGIDRMTGAAARKERLKFDLEVLPAGATFELRMELDPYFENADALELLAATLAEWKEGRGVIGGRVSRGLGSFSLERVRFTEQKLNTVPEVIKLLKDGPDWKARKGDPRWVDDQTAEARKRLVSWKTSDHASVARSWMLAEFTLAADGPMLINDPVRAAQGGFDHAPLQVAYRKGAKYVLPGSSLKGVLRSQAERIARTLATLLDDGTGDVFKAKCPACNPLTEEPSDPVASCNSFILKKLDSKTRRTLDSSGAEEMLCMACRLFGSPWNGSRLRVADASLAPGTTAKLKVMDFLAIDRFTGGGREGAKFDAVVLWNPKFQVRLFLENPQPWELGWLALVLRDLNEGLATVGFGRAKGFGQMHIEMPKMTLGFLHESDLETLGIGNTNALRNGLKEREQTFSGLYSVLAYTEDSNDAWMNIANVWIQAFHQEMKDHPRHKEFVLSEDSYFVRKQLGKKSYFLPDLFPREAR